MSFHNLPPDVFHEILEDSPDFATLRAANRISKKHYEVFQAHPKSIIRAVATNVVGPALLPAMRMADYLHRRSSQRTVSIESLPKEEDFADFDMTKAGDLVPYLETNAHAVHVLRDFYSSRHAIPYPQSYPPLIRDVHNRRKDRSSPKSTLDAHETLRFDRAMYRYWLWVELSQQEAIWKKRAKSYGSDDEDEEDTDFDDDDEEESEPVLCDTFVGLLQSLPSEELCEILDVSLFAEETIRWIAARCKSSGVSYS